MIVNSGIVIAVTGANGFVGFHLCRELELRGYSVRRLTRFCTEGDKTSFAVGDISGSTNWSSALTGVSVVVHCAARVHVMQHSKFLSSAEAYSAVNVDGTRRLAHECSKLGVKRFIYLSSVKVNGEKTEIGCEDFLMPERLINSSFSIRGLSSIGQPFSPFHQPSPQDSYGVSKWESEQILSKYSRAGLMEIVVIRPPLVYGPGVGANFLRLMRLVQSGLPLPFGAIANRRSMVAVDNLTDLIIRCLDHPAASGKTFMVSDGQDLSTPELVKYLALVMGVKSRLLKIPVNYLKFFGILFRRSSEVNRLVDSLMVDISFTKRTLNWEPPISVEEGLRRLVARY